MGREEDGEREDNGEGDGEDRVVMVTAMDVLGVPE